MSPSCSAAYSVIPTRTVVPLPLRTHSCSIGVLQVFGVVRHNALLEWRGNGRVDRSSITAGWARQTLAERTDSPPGCARTRSRGRRARSIETVPADPRTGDLADQTAPEPGRLLQAVGVSDRLHGDRPLEALPVHDQIGAVGAEPGRGDHPHLAVELDHLGTGVAHLLHGVQQHAGGHLLIRVGDPHRDPRSLRRHRAGQDRQLVEPLLRLLLGHPPGVGAALQVGLGLLQLADLALQPSRLRAQTVQDLDQVLASGVGVRVVGRVQPDLHGTADTDDEQDDRGDHLPPPGMSERTPQPGGTGHRLRLARVSVTSRTASTDRLGLGGAPRLRLLVRHGRGPGGSRRRW